MPDEPHLVFVDTNILVYAYDVNAGNKHLQAKAVIEELWRNRKGCLSIQVLQEFYVVVTQKVQNPLKMNEAAEIVFNYNEWHIHVPHTIDILRAIQLQQQFKLSFWDAMIVNSANQVGCHVLLSEDMNEGQTYYEVLLQNPLKQTSP